MPIHYFAGLHLHEITSELTKQIKKEQKENPLSRPVVVVPNTNLIPWLKLNLPKYDDSHLSINIEFTFLEKAILKCIFNSMNIPIWSESEEFYDYESFRKDCFTYLYENKETLFEKNPEIKKYLSEIPKIYYLSDLLTKYFKDYELNRSDWINQWLGATDIKTNINASLLDDPYWNLEKEIYLGIITNQKKNLFYYLSKGKNLPLSGDLHLFCLSNLSGTYIDFLKSASLSENSKFNIYIYQFHNGKVLGQTTNKLNRSLSKFAKPQSYLAKEFARASEKKETPMYSSGGMLPKLKSILLEERIKEENFLNDHTVRVWNAPSTYREIESIAHDILYKLDKSKGELSLLDFAILVPNMNEYKSAIEWVFNGGIYTTEKETEVPTLKKLPYSISDLVAKDTSLVYKALTTIFQCFLKERIDTEDLIHLIQNPLVYNNGSANANEGVTQIIQLLDSLGSLYEENTEENPYTISFGLKRAMISVLADETISWEKLGIVNEPAADEQTIITLMHLWNQIINLKNFFQDEILNVPTTERFQLLETMLSQFFNFQEETEQERIFYRQWIKEIQNWCDTNWNTTKDLLLFINIQTEEIFSNIQTQRGNYLTEGITVSLLQPMRPIPFSHIYIVGLGEGKFPGARDVSRFNLRKNDYQPWDLNRIEIQESLFWETILSAEDSITFSYVGKNTLEDKEFEPCSSLFEIMFAMGIKTATEIPLTPYSRFYNMEILHSYDYSRNLRQYSNWNFTLTKPNFTEVEDLIPSDTNTNQPKEISIDVLTYSFRNPILRQLRENLGYFLEEDEPSSEEPFYFDTLEQFLFKSKFLPFFTETLVKEKNWPWDKAAIEHKLAELSKIAEQKAEYPYGTFHLVTSETLLNELIQLSETYQSIKMDFFANQDHIEYFDYVSIGDTGLRKAKKIPAYQMNETQSIIGEWENMICIGDIFYWFYPKTIYDKPEKGNEFIKDYFGKMMAVFLSACLFRSVGKKLIVFPILSKNNSTLDFSMLSEEKAKEYIQKSVSYIHSESPKYIPNVALNLFFANSYSNLNLFQTDIEEIEFAWKEFLAEESETVLELETKVMKLSPYTKELLENFSIKEALPLLLPLLKKGF
ncbi:exodeoxyribonuclease V subunit gamma (plasmid) [Leptospira sp. WS39.C2]